jgi:hypothetical protein
MITLFKKITDLTPAITVNGTDTFEMVSRQAGTLESVEVTANQIASFVVASVNGIPIYDGNPNGNVVVTGPSLLLGSGNSQGDLWAKTTLTASGTDWFQLINAP